METIPHRRDGGFLRFFRRLRQGGILAAIVAVLLTWPVAAGGGQCVPPAFVAGPPGDNTADAAGTGQLFERIALPGMTDQVTNPDGVQEKGTGSIALTDLDGDHRIDIVIQYDRLGQGATSNAGAPSLTRFWLNRGCMTFEPVAALLAADGPNALPAPTGSAASGSASTPIFADFNHDGWPDFYLTRNRLRSSLYLSRGDVNGDGVRNDFEYDDMAVTLGAANPGSYSRQAVVGDVNADGWLDIAVGGDQIANRVSLGRPYSRLYVFEPGAGGGFAGGVFTDRAGAAPGSGLVPGFGTSTATCDPTVDKASPGIVLRDLDGDRDLDLLQSYHADMNLINPVPPATAQAIATDPCSSGNYRLGMFAWENRISDLGTYVQREEGDGPYPQGTGLVDVGRMRYDEPTLAPDGRWVVGAEGPSISLPYANTADVNNDGHLDVVAVGPADPEWHINSDATTGRFWYGLGGFRFIEATTAAGLDALNWNYGAWAAFWGATLPDTSLVQELGCAASMQRPVCAGRRPADATGYLADTNFADYNNDGWLDLLLVDRRELDGAYEVLRNSLFLNRGDGTFTLVPTEVSGIDAVSTSAETADLDNDGLLDIYFAVDRRNSNPYPDPPVPSGGPDRVVDKVYWNTGALGAKDNHWVRLLLTGLPDGRTIGAQVYLRDPASGALLGRRDVSPVDSYKSSHGLEVHFGLGTRTRIDAEVRLLDGTTRHFAGIPINDVVELDVVAGSAAAQLDKTPPTIDIVTPATGAVYLRGEIVPAAFSCADDGGSRLASCEGTVSAGSAVDTTDVGGRTFRVTARDFAGNTATAEVEYAVVYEWLGFLPPVKDPPALNTRRAGRVVPVRFAVGGTVGQDIFVPGFPRSRRIPCPGSPEVVDPDEGPTHSLSGTGPIKLPVGDGYLYLWDTERAWGRGAGSCREFLVALNDGSQHRAVFRFR